MPRVPRGDLSAYLSAVFTNQLISADEHQHPADDPTLEEGRVFEKTKRIFRGFTSPESGRDHLHSKVFARSGLGFFN